MRIMPDVSPSPEPFTARAAPAAVEDLRARLRATRWPDAPQDAGWSLGTDLAYLRELVAYWADEFDWPAQEAALARLPRFRVQLDDLGVHFVHVRAAAGAVSRPGGPALPLVLCHGWPDSFWRYAKVIPLLTDPAAHGADPADAFDVVVPDMPGYGYSSHPAGPPLNSIAVADLWARLMSVLGYQRFGAAGGDIGSHVSRYLALDYPGRLVAVHRTDAGPPVVTGDPAGLAPRERAWIEAMAAWAAAEGGYSAMHRTKPQTAAFGLTDSPAGLAAWIVEKLRAWSDCGGDIERSFSKDEILTNLTIYWLTGTIGSSMRMYHANAGIPPAQHARRVEVPSGFSFFPGDFLRPPDAWLERVANVVRVTELPRGGHFAPFEEPELYAEELRAFFRPYRTSALPPAASPTGNSPPRPFPGAYLDMGRIIGTILGAILAIWLAFSAVDGLLATFKRYLIIGLIVVVVFIVVRLLAGRRATDDGSSEREKTRDR
jgi:pimeloyl-ACP methyl ester carboxylesterase